MFSSFHPEGQQLPGTGGPDRGVVQPLLRQSRRFARCRMDEGGDRPVPSVQRIQAGHRAPTWLTDLPDPLAYQDWVRLTVDENRVLILIMQGMRFKQVQCRLKMDAGVLKRHLDSIKRKGHEVRRIKLEYERRRGACSTLTAGQGTSTRRRTPTYVGGDTSTAGHAGGTMTSTGTTTERRVSPQPA